MDLLEENDNQQNHRLPIGSGIIYLVAALLVVGGIIVGAILGVTPTKTPDSPSGLTDGVRVIGAIVSGLFIFAGGFTASAAYTTRVSVRDARKVFADELGAIYRNLNRVWIQLTTASESGIEGSIEPDAAFMRVIDAASSLQGQIAEINEMSGQVLTTDQITSTNKALITLRDEIEAASETGPEDERATKQEQLRVLTALTAHAAPGLLSEVEVDCPYCSSPHTFEMSTTIGTTARRFCSKCGNPFNVHRTSSGTFAKRMAATGQSSSLLKVRRQWVCPSCSNKAAISLIQTIQTIEAVCLQCSTAVFLRTSEDDSPDDPKQLLATERGKTFQFVEGNIVGRSGNAPVLDCEGRRVYANIRDAPNNRFVAICETHERIVTTSNAAFRLWLDEHEPGKFVPYL